MKKKLIIAEKPSVAKEIATIFKMDISKNGKGYFENEAYYVTYAFGHLIQLAQPKDYGYETWAFSNLPMLPHPFILKPRQAYKNGKVAKDVGVIKQLGIIKDLIQNSKSIIVATDAGREGELIFRQIYTYLKCNLPFQRLWISSLTEEAIKKGFYNLKNGSEYDNLYLSAKARAEADWLIGLNLTQAITLASGRKLGLLSIGRVQTPTLSLIVKRYLDNINFVSKNQFKIELTLENNVFAECELTDNFEDINLLFDKLNTFSKIHCLSIEEEKLNTNPPLLYDLTSLQKDANNILSLSADDTLKTAQSLYEKKLITYPRTDSKYLSSDISIDNLIQHIYRNNVPSNIFQLGNEKYKIENQRCVNDKLISDHHAIIPTETPLPNLLNNIEKSVYDLIILRTLQAFSAKKISSQIQAEFNFPTDTTLPSFFAKTKHTIEQGFEKFSLLNEKESSKNENLINFKIDKEYKIEEKNIIKSPTQPPKLYTEATLLSAMENVDKSEDLNKEEKQILKATKGLGTPATRAAIIEILFSRKYIERKKKNLVPTEKGLSLIESLAALDIDITNPIVTAEWELKLAQIAENGSYDTFIAEVKKNALDLIEKIKSNAKHIENYYTEKSENIPPGNGESCPICTASITHFEKCVKCSNTECNFIIFKKISGKNITETQITQLLKKGITRNKIKGFISKTNKPFDAFLKLDNGKVTFSF